MTPAARRQRRLRRRLRRTHLPPGIDAGVVSLEAMTEPMVDRLFWRAGFGPTTHDRSTWVGRPVAEPVAWLLETPNSLIGSQGTKAGAPLQPTASDTDLVLEWLDRMIRSTNPFAERLAFFWHRHFANSRDGVDPPQLLRGQIELFRRYADLGAQASPPTFASLIAEVTEDPAMLRYLTGESNVRGSPNENYAREVMELFCLGVRDGAGQPNYGQADIHWLAYSFSGWTVTGPDPDHLQGQFVSSRWLNGPKFPFGVQGNYRDRDALDLILSRPAHAPFICRKLWDEYVVAPPDAATMADLVATYRAGGTELAPVIARILAHPALYASLAEPDMIKPPVVYVVGAMRAMGLGIADATPASFLGRMGQVPYFPPNVAGWEGGSAWLNTNTALARFAFIGELMARRDGWPIDVPGEGPADAVARAAGAVGAPLLAAGTRAAVLDYAGRARSSDSDQRLARQRMLRALIAGGPDAQVM